MDNRLIALLLTEEYNRRESGELLNFRLPTINGTMYFEEGQKGYLDFLKSIACRSTDRYKGITGYRLAVREIENR